MSVINPNDENKSFGVTFTTPPSSSNGIAHIMEHSVLCGSRKYPIKEPFVELLKGSLNTFLNAFTYPDRTCYPVASCNEVDFYNLIDVYLDAVFYPRAIQDPRVLSQEGWHYEVENPADPLSFKGVVFNEMKGVYSSSNSVMHRDVQHALFPDNVYSHDSGGDPAVIPKLDFVEFKTFHETFYHPSNGKFWFYGDDDPTKRLRIIDQFLNDFNKRPIEKAAVSVGVQSKWSSPRKALRRFAIGQEEKNENKHMVSVNWLLTDSWPDIDTMIGLQFLDYLLLGTTASPLRKALIDSKLGSSVVGGGMSDELMQAVFSVGLKDVRSDDATTGKVEAVVFSVLGQCQQNGFTEDQIAAAVNTIEFSLRENNTGSFPRGLGLMLRALPGWIYNDKPFEGLQFEKPLERLKSKIARKEPVFQELINSYFLNNFHRIDMIHEPCLSLLEEQVQKEKQELQKAKDSMTADQINTLIEQNKALKTFQETPDRAEALKCVPGLALSDLPLVGKTTPMEVKELKHCARVIMHDIFCNGVVYVDIGFDLSRVPGRLLYLLPLFSRGLKELGTHDMDFVALSQRIGKETGGISTSSGFSNTYTERNMGYLRVKGKAINEKVPELFSIVKDMVLGVNLANADRFRQMAGESKSGMESAFTSSGHSFASSRIASKLTPVGWATEEMGGVNYYHHLQSLIKRIESDWMSVQRDLEELKTFILTANGLVVSVTADHAGIAKVLSAADSFLDSLPVRAGHVSQGMSFESSVPVLSSNNEAYVVPGQVNYCGKGANLYKTFSARDKLNIGSISLITKYLGTSWLWDRVRVSGGAYGGFCSFNSLSGNFTYLSYRDPNLTQTLDVYDETAAFLRKASQTITQEELTKSIIGCIGDVDSYQLPDSRGASATRRLLLGDTEDARQLRREQILKATPSDFSAFADALEMVKRDGVVVVVGKKQDIISTDEALFKNNIYYPLGQSV